MKRSLLVIVTGDPRLSARPAEAVRIAAGLSANGRLDVTLCLRGASVQALGEPTDELKDGDYFTRYLPMVAETGHLVFLQTSTEEHVDVESPSVPALKISEADLTKLEASSDRVLRF